MKIKSLQIKNFRSLKDIEINPEKILALVGRNNTGKSNVLRALELFFEDSTKLLNDESFFNHDITNPIRITITFESLTAWEKDKFKSQMNGDLLQIIREYGYNSDESLVKRSFYIKEFPEPDWLNPSEINSGTIKEWWEEKESLIVNGVSFSKRLGSRKPNVGEWKEHAVDFLNENSDIVPMVTSEAPSPKGFPGVLKGALPEFIFIPAVRDVTDEAKVLKSNPFGRLINSMLEKITEQKKEILKIKLNEIEEMLNRGATERIEEIKQIEAKINELMSTIIECDVEIVMALPKLHEIFGATRIYADDGIRTPIEMKGHGLQRAMIFTILRAYAELANTEKAGEDAKQRTTIFAIEEPELYLHPQCQRAFMNVFREIVKSQDHVFYSTQSNLFVDVRYFDEVCIMRRNNVDDEYYSIAHSLSMSTLLHELKERKGIDGTDMGMREQYSHAFNPNVNEGFFADKVVIVEGDSEAYSIPLYCRALDYDIDKENVSIVHSYGKGQIVRLLRIFKGFNIPSYVVFDGDKSGKTDAKRLTKEILNLLGHRIDDISQLQTMIRGNFCVFENNYDDVIQEELGDKYEKLVDEVTALVGSCGKPIKYKYIASKILEEIKNGRSAADVGPKTIFEMIRQIIAM